MVALSGTRVRLFRSDFFEWFSKVHPTTPFVIYVPVITGALILGAMHSSLSMSAMPLTFVAGFMTWTFTEYFLHRFVFHYEPRSKWGQRISYIIHGVHHDDPRDPLRLVMPPIISILFATAAYGLGFIICGYESLYFVSGWALGYLYYDFTHYAIHRTHGFRGFGFQRTNHLIHHFKASHRCYGVTSTFWDHVFRTQS